ncbi:16S rRNA (uracil(1498)-N(3))-methyltransferase [Deltaproteobacteria bacterium Smac51]|nr:16S rRNA (uracil(1498)-N(3))-methyltransferase [Deltaproteobacteria bacterium Smac51]
MENTAGNSKAAWTATSGRLWCWPACKLRRLKNDPWRNSDNFPAATPVWSKKPPWTSPARATRTTHMRTLRFLWPAKAPLDSPDEVFLAPDQARHGVLVLRLEPGAAVEAVSVAGLAPAVVTTAETGRGGRPRLGLRLTGSWTSFQPASGARLAMALIQSQRFDWVVEKSVELGAATLIPLITERVKAGDGRPGEAKRERWLRLAEEARKQCGRPDPLVIMPPITLPQAATLPGPSFFLSPTAGADEILSPEPGSPLLVIGPEGGFSLAEEAILKAAGFKPRSLGPLTLRAETAALAALARLL